MTSLSQVLNFIVLTQLLLIIVFLFSNKKGRRLSNWLLGFFFTSLFLGFLDATLVIFNLVSSANYAFLLNGFIILHPPLLLLYTHSITRQNFRLTFSHLVHLIPFLIVAALLVIFYHTQTLAEKEVILSGVESGRGSTNLFIMLGGLIYEIAYLIPVKIEIHKYQKRIRQSFSNVDNLDLNWLNFLVNLFIFSFVLSTISSFLRQTHFEYFTEFALTLASLGLFLFINAVLLKGLYNNEVFTKSNHLAESSKQLADIPADKILRELEAFMKNKKPFLDAYLSLEVLSDQVQVPSRDLSLVLNNYARQNFFDFVNRYRIEEAKSLLTEKTSQELTILEIMYESGFNSKSSFNTAFKKYTGVTPSAWRANHSI
jgi:AraC-like DNA-binding protein